MKTRVTVLLEYNGGDAIATTIRDIQIMVVNASMGTGPYLFRQGERVIQARTKSGVPQIRTLQNSRVWVSLDAGSLIYTI